ncbi:MAG: DUF58 domain-containing protein [Thermodesulfovibrionales bacterium]|nr:DUF58 domain-containing protein [Thermodesulfovibrionales bacterium]
MRPTREGARFLLATGLIGLAAMNTGNNLIYIIFGMLLSVLVLSYALLRTNLSGLLLKVEAERPVFAGQKAYFRITVRNRKKRFTSYSLRIRFPKGLLAEERTGFIPVVAPGSSETSEVELVFRRRGSFRYGDFVVESSFPFIFFYRRVTVQVEGEVVVYPRIRELELDALRRGASGERTTNRPGRSDDLLVIREFRCGDDMKHINWKASARSESLMVKEFTEHESRMITLVLDNSSPAEEFAFERGVSFAASVAWKLGLEGFLVRLAMCGAEVSFGTGLEHVYRVLDALADAEDGSSEACPGVDDVEEGEGMVVVILKNELSPMAAIAAGEGTVVVNAASAL